MNICKTCTQQVPISYCTECSCMVEIPKAEKEIRIKENGVIYKLKCPDCDKWFNHVFIPSGSNSSLSQGF